MKNYEDMARDVLHRIDEYEFKRKRKQIRLKKAAAFAAPAFAAAVAGIFIWKGGADLNKRGQIVGTVADTSVSAIVSADNSNSAADISNTSATAGKTEKNNGQTTETTVRSDNKEGTASTQADKQSSDTTGTLSKDGDEPKLAETQTASSEQSLSLSNSASGDRLGDAVINGEYYVQTFSDGENYTEDRYIGSGSDFEGFYKNCGTSAEFYTVKESADIVLVKLGNGGQVYLKRTNEAPPETPSLITSYPITASASYAAPPNGTCGLSEGLYYAMEDYGGSADYLLKGDIFSDNHKIFDREVLQAEAERLSSLGYNVTVVSESMQSGEDYYYLTLTLTYEQIRNFPKADNYGFFLMLYDGS